MLVDDKAPFVCSELPLPLNDYGTVCYFTEHSSQTAGSACDSGMSSKVSALGEYLERTFLYHGVAAEGHYSSPELTDEELAILPFKSSFLELEYVTVTGFIDHQPVRIPRSMINLNTSSDVISHFRDSSGCALGRDKAHAKLAACLEFIERQSLVIGWHSQLYTAKVTSEQIITLCEGKKKTLFERLVRSGTVTMLINTISGVSCYSGVMLYASAREVKYSVSSGCALSLSELVNKLISEMWQSYLFIYNNLSNEGEIERDYYKAHFLSMNQADTLDLWGAPFLSLPAINQEQCSSYSQEDFYRSLQTLDARFYLYQAQTQDGFWFCKFLSPDFFPHMSSVHLSKIPDYCKHTFNLHKLRDIEIPFP